MSQSITKNPASYGELIRQYLELRDQHPGIILLFRVGSFYEVLFEDAELVARELGLKLGERPSGGAASAVAQCGFAHHALDHFLPRLLQRGYRVAVCDEGREEQGGLRQRDVVQTLTPGTVTDPRLLQEDKPNYLVAVTARGAQLGLAWTDLAAGEFRAGEFSLEDAASELQRLDPAEVLVPSDFVAPEELLLRRPVTPVASSEGAEAAFEGAYPDVALPGLPLAQAAAGLVVRYLEATQGDEQPLLDHLQPASAADSLRLDATTQRHLEIVETERTRARGGSLLASVDRCVTPMGRRMLRGWLLRPLTHLGKIAVRQRIVAELTENPALRTELSANLTALLDLERLAGRAAAQRTSLEDLGALAGVAEELPSLARTASKAKSMFLKALANPRPGMAAYAQRAAEILPAAGDDASVRRDASPALAKASARLQAAATWQTRYIERLRAQRGLSRVKLERTATQGLFLEVPVNTAVPGDWIRRGGLQKVERYTTEDLEAHAIELAEAEALVASETKALLARLRVAAAAVAEEARDLARYLAAADALLSLARVAVERGWTRPEVDDGATLLIEGGRHPVVESTVDFQPNDTLLEARGAANQVVVLTGPNMAGKSTWMRQIGLITLLAQAGSFVPATRARIGLVDAIFTRIGAVDDLAGGRSTFMMEMLETAAVLKSAGDRGLVLLDEIGRGTSTHDGMAIAWAVIEHLATGPVRPRAILATHYHELAALKSVHPQVTLLRAAVDERPDGIVFTHRIEAGAADRSFGIEVARLAGLPGSLLERARQVADAVEPLSAEVARQLGDIGRLQGKQGGVRPPVKRRAG